MTPPAVTPCAPRQLAAPSGNSTAESQVRKQRTLAEPADDDLSFADAFALNLVRDEALEQLHRRGHAVRVLFCWRGVRARDVVPVSCRTTCQCSAGGRRRGERQGTRTASMRG